MENKVGSPPDIVGEDQKRGADFNIEFEKSDFATFPRLVST